MASPHKATTMPTEVLTEAAGIAAAEAAGVRLTSPDRIEYPDLKVSKGVLAAYYAAVAERMLPFAADHPLSLVRCPQGRSKVCFFQKHDTGGFPPQFKSLPVTEKDGQVEKYFYLDGLASLLAGVQMNVLEFHLWGARCGGIEKPDRLIFDIDPDPGLGFDAVKEAATDIRDALGELGLESFPLLTGGKGVHVIVPLEPDLEWPDVKTFCHGFAERLATQQPDRFVANMSKAKRAGHLFIDYLRNERGSTAIAPWSTRSREGAPCAVPVGWDELPALSAANMFGIEAAAARARQPDPWAGYRKAAQKLSPALVKELASA